jgi:hypothetical protein
MDTIRGRDGRRMRIGQDTRAEWDVKGNRPSHPVASADRRDV